MFLKYGAIVEDVPLLENRWIDGKGESSELFLMCLKDVPGEKQADQ